MHINNIYIGELRNTLSKYYIDSKVLIISNEKVLGLHIAYLLENIKAKEIFICSILDGEEHKNMDSVGYILDYAFNAGFNRDDVFIAFGGGVIGDIVGFSAGIYKRGLQYIQIPTTLLGQIDSSIGGKTGVNTAFGKNLIGLFNQPLSTYSDPYFLHTLGHRELNAGIIEIIKMSVCFDQNFFNFLEKNSLNDKDNLTKAITKSIEIKSKVVHLDEKEQGIRGGLNYGHSFGHIVELFYNKYNLLHGECVGIGIKIINKLALKLGYLSNEEDERINRVLDIYLNISNEFSTNNKTLDITKDIVDDLFISFDQMYQRLKMDKKNKGNKVTLVIPKGIGSYDIIPYTKEELRGLLAL